VWVNAGLDFGGQRYDILGAWAGKLDGYKMHFDGNIKRGLASSADSCIGLGAGEPGFSSGSPLEKYTFARNNGHLTADQVDAVAFQQDHNMDFCFWSTRKTKAEIELFPDAPEARNYNNGVRPYEYWELRKDDP